MAILLDITLDAKDAFVSRLDSTGTEIFNIILPRNSQVIPEQWGNGFTFYIPAYMLKQKTLDYLSGIGYDEIRIDSTTYASAALCRAALKTAFFFSLGGDGGGGAWGGITGTLSDQTDLQAALDAREVLLTFDNGLTRTVNSVAPGGALSGNLIYTGTAGSVYYGTGSGANRIGTFAVGASTLIQLVSAGGTTAQTLTLNSASSGTASLAAITSGQQSSVSLTPTAATISSGISTPVTLTLNSTGSASLTGANLSNNNFLEGFTSTATAAGTTTLTISSTYNQVFTGSTTQTVVLPTAAAIVNGLSFFITNLSSGNVTVNTSGSNTVQVMAGNTSLLITCINTAGGTGTASWSWSYSNNGAGLVDAFILSASGGTYATATPAQLALSYLTYKGWNYPTALRVNRDKFEYIPPPVVQSAISNITTTALRANWAIPQRTNISTSNENAVVDTYECQISTSSTFASILQTQYSTGTTYTFTSLTTATLYYTRIRACLSTLYSGEYEYGAFSNTVNATTA